MYLDRFLTLCSLLRKRIMPQSLWVLSAWPDLGKFLHFGVKLSNLGHFENVHLLYVQILTYFGKF